MRVAANVDVMALSKGWSIFRMAVDCKSDVVDGVFCGRDVVGVYESEDECLLTTHVPAVAVPGERSESTKEAAASGANDGERRTLVVTECVELGSFKSVTTLSH